MLRNSIPYRFLLIGVILLFSMGYLWCFLNPHEWRDIEHNDSSNLGSGFCFHFYYQNLHLMIPGILVFIVVLSTISPPTPGEILAGFTHPLIQPPRSL